jgi:hypothetical protein
MSESKFTPGPWRVHAGDEIIADDCLHVAFVKANFLEHMETQLANARLIAAAPEMLACLEELLEWIYSGYDASIYDIEEAARVVQKAKGEE